MRLELTKVAFPTWLWHPVRCHWRTHQTLFFQIETERKLHIPAYESSTCNIQM